MKPRRMMLIVALLVLSCCGAALAQDTASITGTVTDSSGATVPNAQVTVNSAEQGLSRTAAANGSGDYLFAGLPIGSYDITVTKDGFKKYQAKGVILRVAEKARVDVALQVGATSVEVLVEGTEVAQVETQSSDLGGIVTGKEISQLELNGRDFKQLITLVPGVSNQTGADEGGVGVTASNSFSVNGGRVEYNNWEVDGAAILDNGQNNTLNVTPSIDAIGEFKVLTSNYGAQYGKNGSGTIEVETKSGTQKFHGDAYEFVRNNMFNSPAWNQQGIAPPYHKNDFGYTFGGPVYIPGVYNKNKTKTFFFWSEEWRKDLLPQTFHQLVPTAAERAGNFSDICALGPADCPSQPQFINGVKNPNAGQPYPGNQVGNPNDPNVQALLTLIPAPNFGQVNVPGQAFFNQINSKPTNWREELLKVDHNLTDKERISFHYIHDSWDTLNETPLWTDGGSFPTIQTQFKGPGISLVARLSSTLSPTLLNEFVAGYTTDHIVLNNVGNWRRPSNTTFGSIFPGADRGVIPGINLVDVGGVYGNFSEDPGFIPNGPYNSNPSYTFKDNVSKLIGKHNLQFGGYFEAIQKNELGGELSAGSFPGLITFDPNKATTTTGNPFSDLLLGYAASFGQQNNAIKYYNRYKMFEPYFNDDWHITSRLTLNLGVRVSLFGTYRERYHQAFNFDPAHYVQGQTTVDSVSDIVNKLTSNGATPTVTNLPNGIVQCGVTTGVPVSCMQGHLVNPAPRIGFAWDPKGNGKTAIRGGYGMFFEHGNGNEGNTNSLENSPPLAYTVTENNPTPGYPNLGTGTAGAQFPLSVIAAPTNEQWPYVQQWHLDWQQEFVRNTVATISYVGSKGTHLARQSNLNQLHPVSASQNPYKPGQAISSANTDCSNIAISGTTVTGITVNGNPVSGNVAQNVAIAACGANADPFRPYPGYSNITYLQPAASSIYNALQVAVRRSMGGLELNLAYTYSHSIDDSSDRSDGSFTNAYDPAANRASSNFDERHVFNVGYVWDIPLFKSPGLAHKVLGGWQYSGITSFNSGSPFSVIFSTDNGGVANGVGSASYADIVGDPRAGVVQNPGAASNGRLFYNPAAYAAPRGLTFGDSGRNSLRNPDFINFDMALFKHFTIKESTAVEFRAEAFNAFNHTEWLPIAGAAGSGAGSDGSGNNTQGNTTFLYSGGVHQARVLQLALKFLF